MKRPYNNKLRSNPKMVPQISQNVRLSSLDDAFLLYNGAFEPYEDPADYVRVRGGWIA